MNLYGRANNDIELMKAIEDCGDILFQSPVIALLYTPDWCGFAQVEQAGSAIDLTLSARDKRRFDAASVFEARVFSDRAELRWLKQWPNKGRAALIAEEDISKYLDVEAGTFENADFIDQTYLLWGEGVEPKRDKLPANWSRLAMARIGTLDVPYPLSSGLSAVSQQGERIYLVSREYLAVPDDEPHGNVTVVDERSMKLVDEKELIRMGKAGLIELEVMQ